MTETNTPATSGKIYAALAKAQAAFKPCVKNRKANYGKYADLASILAATQPALNANGLAVIQRVTSRPEGVEVETILGHESGETISSGPLFMPVTPSKGMNPAQAFGSARTYACRYSLSSLLGIAADDDDDGNAAGFGSASERYAERKPQGFTLTQDHVDQAKAFAVRGMAAYEAFFKALPVEHRKALIDSNWHEALKREAQAADQGGAQA